MLIAQWVMFVLLLSYSFALADTILDFVLGARGMVSIIARRSL